MNQTERIMISLIGSEVCNTPLDLSAFADHSDEFYKQIYALAKSHDVAHLVGSALLKHKLCRSTEIETLYRESVLSAVYRYEKINYEYRQICRVLDEVQIPYIPLKGTVIREYYPEPWMRTSSDIDVLVHKEDLDNAVKALCDTLEYKANLRGLHDVSLFSYSNIHIELHYNLIESDLIGNAEKLLDNVWDYATPENGTYKYILSDDMYYYYHIAHMAKHFVNGGCGIRPVIDLCILQCRIPHDDAKRKELIGKGGLTVFDEAVTRLSEIWFSGRHADEFSEKMSQFIFEGGTYGNFLNNSAMKQAKNGNRASVIFRYIFKPYRLLKYRYPRLENHRWLMPYYQVRRWFDMLFREDRKKYMEELKTIITVKRENVSEMQNLLKALELE